MKNMFMSAASDIQRTLKAFMAVGDNARKWLDVEGMLTLEELDPNKDTKESLSLIHISEPTRPY